MTSDQQLLEHVIGTLGAGFEAVQRKGVGARNAVKPRADISTVGDVTANEAIVQHLRESGLPAIIHSEELDAPVRLSNQPVYSVVVDDVDGTRNQHYGLGMLPHGTIAGIAEGTDPRFNDFLAEGFLEFNSGNLFYALRNRGAFVVERRNPDDGATGTQISTSGITQVEAAKVMAVDMYMMGDLAPHFAQFAARMGADYASAGAHLALLAAGSIDLFVKADNCINPKKLATGEEIGPLYLLVKEAGGAILDWNGNDLGPETVNLSGKKTFHSIAAASEELGKEFAAAISRVPEVRQYMERKGLLR